MSILSGVSWPNRLCASSLKSASRKPLMPSKCLKSRIKPLEMRCVELAVDAVERMGDGVSDLRFLEILLQIENVFPDRDDFGVLCL